MSCTVKKITIVILIAICIVIYVFIAMYNDMPVRGNSIFLFFFYTGRKKNKKDNKISFLFPSYIWKHPNEL